MKREETTSQDQLIAELNALRQQLSALEERLDESKTAKRATVDNEAVVSDVSDYIGQQRSILEAAPEAIIAVDNRGRIVLANEQAQTLFGYDRDELLEKTVEMLIPERFHETHIQHRLGYQANPITRLMRERRRLAGRRKDGTEIPLKIGLSFTHLPSGEVDPDSMGSDGRLAIAMIAEAEESEPYDAYDDPSMAAAGTLISTKLQPPRLTSDYIPRPRLFKRFDRQRSLTLVSAPAGYGKSTLMSSWLETLDCPTAWLSLDENDNDLAVFLSYFIAAIQTEFSNIGANTLTLLNSAELPPLQIIATSLINELNSIEGAYVLVLDDYHLIQNKRVHDLLTKILLHLPPGLHLVLASRVDPPLTLANLRARGQVREVRAHDLRFNQNETAGLVKKLLGAPVDLATAASLEERSEGWVTGLRLAVLSREYLGSRAPIPNDIHANNRFVTDYLMSSVLSLQRSDVQQWLLQSAILDRFSPKLCEAICLAGDDRLGTDLDGESFVDLVSRANLFVIPLDQHQEWFRFHHLFQGFLQSELRKQRTAAEISTLHARASEWLEKQGLLEEAFQHALNSGRELTAAQLIERNRLFLLNDDKWPTVERWLAKLPDDIEKRRPGLMLARAWVYFYQFALGAIPPLLQMIESAVEDEPDATSMTAEVDFFWGHHWYWLGESQRSLDKLSMALEHLPATYHQGRAEAEIFHALARHSLGQKEAVVQELRKTLHTDHLPDSIRFRLFGALIFIHILSSESNKAIQVTLQMRDVVARSGTAYIATWIPYLQALVHYGCNNLKAAAERFAKLVENRYAVHTRAAIDGLAGLALTHQALGQTDKANSVMSQLFEFALQLRDPSYASIARSFQARLWLLQGDLESAVRWQETAELEFDAGLMFYWLEVPRLTRCRVLIAQGTVASLQEAIELLTGHLQDSQTHHNVLRMIEISILLAVAYQKVDQTNKALDNLEIAVNLSRPASWIQPFVEVGPELVDLLRQSNNQGVAPDFIAQILTAYPEIAEPGTDVVESHLQVRSIQTELLEQLTYREREVLDLLAQDLSNQEIASSLTISPHTVKRHTASIYRKLDVKNRRQAVLKAESLGILHPR
ncbi:MAG: hypothetical protein AMJ56_17815 [Anaerolineae bacterium SG8_19]|nr:MAG: hypothetical protein AMJ56_17815 [Anaerolineae bacterium SG8_19]